ncbi:hypothetical protein KM043_005371 [Ampulex compressa]|nr:hypothetical protein KM043_005371 [Ampulex compressa]
MDTGGCDRRRDGQGGFEGEGKTKGSGLSDIRRKESLCAGRKAESPTWRDPSMSGNQRGIGTAIPGGPSQRTTTRERDNRRGWDKGRKRRDMLRSNRNLK